jgi:hypothetical protein
MSNISGFERIYGAMFAGRIADHTDDVYQSIVYVAGDILRSDKVHIGVYKSEGAAFYFAAPSEMFSSTIDFATPLVAAVPGHPDHKGDGAYLLTQGNRTVAVICVGQQFDLVFNSTDSINEMLTDMGLNAYDVDDVVSQPLLVESSRGRLRHFGDKFSKNIIKVSAILSAVSFSVAILASLADAAFTVSLKNESEKNANEMNSLVTKIEYTSPLSNQLGNLNRLSATVVRAGGWINEYQLKGDVERFAVTLPEWVTQDYIAALGPSAIADHDTVNNVIKVVKK